MKNSADQLGCFVNSGTFQLHTAEAIEKRQHRVLPANVQVADFATASVSGNARQRRMKVRQWKKAGLTVVQYSPLKQQTFAR